MAEDGTTPENDENPPAATPGPASPDEAAAVKPRLRTRLSKATTDLLRVLEVLALLVSLILLTWQSVLLRQELRLTRLHHEESFRENRIDRSAGWLDRIADQELWDKLRSTRGALLDEGREPLERIKTIEADQVLRTDLRYVMNRFETLATLYNMNALDKDYIRRTMGPALTEYFKNAKLWVEDRRKVQDPAAYAEYEKMVDDLNSIRTAP